MSRSLRISIYLPPMMLVVVATCQMVFAHSGTLTPWKGGGFGMFSTIDSPAGRVVAIWAAHVTAKRIALRRRSAAFPGGRSPPGPRRC